jgi:hypothetical protein
MAHVDTDLIWYCSGKADESSKIEEAMGHKWRDKQGSRGKIN